MKTANQILQDLADVWSEIPARAGPYTPLEKWFKEQMAPVMSEVQAFLKRIDPEVPLRQRVLNVLAIRTMRDMSELAECLDIPDRGLQRRLLDDIVWELLNQGRIKADDRIHLVKT